MSTSAHPSRGRLHAKWAFKSGETNDMICRVSLVLMHGVSTLGFGGLRMRTKQFHHAPMRHGVVSPEGCVYGKKGDEQKR
jgi:hypothetical protein